MLTSNVHVQGLTDQQTASLYKLCKVWGYAKYHHPDIVAGKMDWDRELFPVMQQVLSAEGEQQANQILADWICGYPIDYTPDDMDRKWQNIKRQTALFQRIQRGFTTAICWGRSFAGYLKLSKGIRRPTEKTHTAHLLAARWT